MANWRDSYLIKFLKDDTVNARISVGNHKWMVFVTRDEWVIYEQEPYAKKLTVLYRGELSQEALDILRAE